MSIRSILKLAPVIPVLTIEHIDHAVPLARALFGGGLRVLEVTLRTPACLPAVEAMRKAVPDAVVGVGHSRGQRTSPPRRESERNSA